MKYIDAEKLKAEIERLYDIARDASYNGEIEGEMTAYDKILSLITSLQQERPDGYNRAMLEVNEYVDKLYDNASIGLNEYDSGLYNGIAETCMKLRGFIKARLGSDERPEVDLEKEVEMYISSKKLLDYAFLVPSIARHFYELGLNARKVIVMCNIQFPHFGASYPDATCIDGYLWDLDSYENGFLTIGGDDPCPFCNTEEWLKCVLDNEEFDSREDALAWVERMRAKYELGLNARKEE